MPEINNLEYKSHEIALKSYDDVKGTFTGYASAFNKVDAVNDTIDPKAYDNSIDAWSRGVKKIYINYDHYDEIILSDNVISITTDEYGLLVEIQISDEAKEMYKDLFEGFVEKTRSLQLFMSIGGKIIDSKLGKGRWDKKWIANANDTIYEMDLIHIAFTEYPIDSNAKMLEVKSRVQKKEKEDLLNLNSLMKSITGETTATQFLSNHKENMSNTNIKNFVLHCKSLWKKEPTIEEDDQVSALRPESKDVSANGDDLYANIAKCLTK